MLNKKKQQTAQRLNKLFKTLKWIKPEKAKNKSKNNILKKGDYV